MESKERLAARISPELRFAEYAVRGRRIHCARLGSGPPVVLLHGATIGWSHWHANLNALAERATVFALDLPGSGQSSAVDFRRCDLESDFVSVVEDFLRQYCGRPAVLLGHSFGAWIAARIALRGAVPIRKLVLVAPVGLDSRLPGQYWPLVWYPLVKFLTLTAMKPTLKNMRQFLGSVLAASTELPDDFVAYVTDCVRAQPSGHPLFFIHRLTGLFVIRREVLLTGLERLTVPTLVVLGGKDPLVSAAAAQKCLSGLPSVEIKVFDSSGHVPPIEQPEKFNRVVTDFMMS